MADFVLLHGAFRGPWAWERVVPLLERDGHRPFAVDLTGGAATLDSYVDAVVAVFDDHTLDGAVLVGHSQGGFVARAALPQVADRVSHVVYLDAPVPDTGETAFDFRPPGTPPPPVEWGDAVPPRPVEPGAAMSRDDADWINARLVPQAVAPSMSPVVAAPDVPATYAFCADTPPGFPCDITRARLDERRVPYEILPGPHDAILTHPAEVTALLTSAVA